MTPEETAGGDPAVVQRVLAGMSKGCVYAIALLDPDARIEWVSPSIASIAGWLPEHVIGRSALELVHPDDIEGLVRLLADEATGPHPYISGGPGARAVNEVRLRNVAGGWQTIELAPNSQIHADDVRGIVIVLRDVSERRLLDEVYDAFLAGLPIEATAERIANLLAWQVGDVFVRIELDGRVVASHGTHDPSAHDIVVPVDATSARITAQCPTIEPTEWIRILVERAAALLRLAVVRHLGELQLRRSLDEKAALISAVSHDLSSPLAAISIMSTLLDGSHEALSVDQRRELTQRINSDAQRTSRLLTDLTSADRLLRGATPPVGHRVDVNALLRRVLHDVDTGGRRLANTTIEAGLYVVADPMLTERMIDNLIANAVKHTPTDSTIVVAACALGATEILVTIDDNGPGVPEADRSSVFDAYSRGSDSTARPGSGMGLFLVRTFAEVQNGRVWCEPSPQGGARFAVVLPRDLSDVAEAAIT
ncbi:MAG: hypothetical protein RLZZ623_3523 [Actinomycetota bacterium]